MTTHKGLGCLPGTFIVAWVHVSMPVCQCIPRPGPLVGPMGSGMCMGVAVGLELAVGPAPAMHLHEF